MKKYLTITKSSFIAGLLYKVHFFFQLFGNMTYLILIYFLWRSIFKNSDGTINGMTFEQVFIYLALASSILPIFQTWIEWEMSGSIIRGTIVKDLTKPVDYQLLNLFGALGFALNNLATVTVPSLVIVCIIAGSYINLGANLLVFVAALVLAYLISFAIDYCIGLISFYTESVWGIIVTKEVIILLLSGAVMPLSFFPQNVRSVVEFLPFHAIFNTPLTILISKDLSFQDYIGLILNQAFWVVVLFALGRVFYMKAIKVVTVNGG